MSGDWTHRQKATINNIRRKTHLYAMSAIPNCANTNGSGIASYNYEQPAPNNNLAALPPKLSPPKASVVFIK
jgi:hypothetical protein